MNDNIQNGSMPLTQQLGFKLIVLFLLTFLIFFVLLSVYGVFMAYGESREAEQNVVLQPKPIVIDPQMRDRLARVLTLDEGAIETVSVRDPFQDRAGLSGIAARQGLAAVSSPGVTSGTAGDAATGGTRAGSGATDGTGSPAAPAAEQPTPTEATRRRYSAWLERARLDADVELDPRIFAIEDLQPVGVVSGGTGQQEVMFFSAAADRTVSFPVGTMFYDGRMIELRPDGVVFSFFDERRTVRMRSWQRAIRSNVSFWQSGPQYGLTPGALFAEI
jgi:hypothetical protein